MRYRIVVKHDRTFLLREGSPHLKELFIDPNNSYWCDAAWARRMVEGYGDQVYSEPQWASTVWALDRIWREN